MGGGDGLLADLVLPEAPKGIVLFAHGSGSSRHSPRNQQVARALNQRGLGTLLLDLLLADEELERSNVFDIALLTERLVAATRWTRTEASLDQLSVGYFGASTGAAAALAAALSSASRSWLWSPVEDDRTWRPSG